MCDDVGMRLRPALLLTVLLVLLATTLPGQAAPPPPSLAALSNIQGVNYSNVHRPTALLAADVQRLRTIGVNHINFYVYLFVDSPTSSSVHRGATTPTDLELGALIDLVHRSGMTVTVSPLPWWDGGDGTLAGNWRGMFQPEDPDAFFDSWRFFTNHYAELSERHDVEMFSIGSEQNSLQHQAEQWRRTAAEARQHFSGPLTYMATAGNALEEVPFWDALDVVSIAAYYSVSQDAQPTYDQVRSAWEQQVIPRIRAIAAGTGKKVLIAETGFVNAMFFGKLPYEPSPSPIPAPQAQADAYAAVLDALAATPGRSDFLLGIGWWDWDPYSTSPAQATFSPRGKLAECVLAEKWGGGAVSSLAALLPCGASRP